MESLPFYVKVSDKNPSVTDSSVFYKKTKRTQKDPSAISKILLQSRQIVSHS